jgi:hypothetical protein
MARETEMGSVEAVEVSEGSVEGKGGVGFVEGLLDAAGNGSGSGSFAVSNPVGEGAAQLASV